MNQSEIPFLTVGELSRLIEAKELSPVEVTQAYLRRIDDLDFKFNAYLTVCRRQALEQAREAEAAIARGDYQGPMHGIPVAVKDQVSTQGIRTTNGSRILADFIPDQDATVVANLKKAGAILLGKNNQSEFALAGSQRYSAHRNPWDLDMYTGGSSSRLRIRYRCLPVRHLFRRGYRRFDSTSCSMVRAGGPAAKLGRVSRHGVMRGCWSMDQVGPISRTVEDAAITLGRDSGIRPERPLHTGLAGARLPACPGWRRKGHPSGRHSGIGSQRNRG